MDDSGHHNITGWLGEIRNPETAQQAWANLIPRLFPIMAKRAREAGLGEHDRESAEQESHERLYEQLSNGAFTITNRAELFATFATIAHGKAVDKRRALSRRKARETAVPEGDVDALANGDVVKSWLEGAGPSPEALEEAQLLEQRFLSVIHVDPKLEALFILVYEKGLEIKEAAAQLGISLATAHRRNRQILAIARTLREDNDLSWLVEPEPDRATQRDAVRSLLASEAQRVFERIQNKESILNIGNTCAATPTRGFMLLAEIDNIAHVVRYERRLRELRDQIRSSGAYSQNAKLREEVGPGTWNIFEAWCSGMNAREMLDSQQWSSEAVFKALRAFHESARPIREAL
ncbi:MAG: RNA polymerase sigma factor [Phycisphaerae bacterium]